MSSTCCRVSGSGFIRSGWRARRANRSTAALPLADDLGEVEALVNLVEQSGIIFMPEFARRCYPATLRLKELLATQLGPPRLVVGHTRLYGFDRYGVPGPATQIAPAPLSIDPGSYLIDWCCFVFQALPQALHGYLCQVLSSPENGDQEADFETFVASFGAGATAQISYGRYHRGPWGDASRFLPSPGFQVFAERGAAWLEMPEKIQWSNSAGATEERLPLEPTVGDVLNDQFHRLVRGDHVAGADDSRCPRNRTTGQPVTPRATRARWRHAEIAPCERQLEGWPLWGWNPPITLRQSERIGPSRRGGDG